MKRFEIVDQDIDFENLKSHLIHQRSGALVTFEGWVRNHNEGQSVDRLEYEAYPELANKEGARIVEAALEKFDVVEIVCQHRVGLLEIGGMAVWVGVCSEHRQAAFDACQFIIDQVKDTVPIWKREHYSTGKTEWVNCHKIVDDTL